MDRKKNLEKNERWGARHAGLENGDYGFEGDGGAQGSGQDGAQGYGIYSDEDRKERQYGIRAGGNYGVYDIGGLGAKGYHHLANGTYDDMEIPEVKNKNSN